MAWNRREFPSVVAPGKPRSGPWAAALVSGVALSGGMGWLDDSVPVSWQAVPVMCVVSAWPARAEAALALLLEPMAAALKPMGVGACPVIMLVCDGANEREGALRRALAVAWSCHFPAPLPSVTVVPALSFHAVEDRFARDTPQLELLLVMQLESATGYAEGLAAMLLSPDEPPGSKPCGYLLRPMPLAASGVAEQLAIWQSIQTDGRRAKRLLVDTQARADQVREGCRTLDPQAPISASTTLHPVEPVCGKPGPLAGWLMTPLALELARHLCEPVAMLFGEGAQQWVCTLQGAPSDE